MSFLDLFTLILENLARRKGRVLLTAVGVIIGTAAVVLLISLGVGLQQNAASQLGGIGDLTKIQVWPNYGEWDPVTGQPTSVTILSDQTVTDIAALPGVTAVIPQDYLQSWGFLTVGQLEGGGQHGSGARIGDHWLYRADEFLQPSPPPRPKRERTTHRGRSGG